MTARDHRWVESKIAELEKLGQPYVIICGENLNLRNVVYRKPIGKWDAINYGHGLVPPHADVVVLNDVDTRIVGFEEALACMRATALDLAYCAVKPTMGPQREFYAIADPIRKRFHIFASGELMLVRRHVLDRLIPIPPCVGEDSYLLFKALELGYKTGFLRDTYAVTQRTANAKEEQAYKERTTLGVLQALDFSNPPPWIRLFYWLTPILALLLRPVGSAGQSWSKGMLRGFRLHLRGSSRTRFDSAN